MHLISLRRGFRESLASSQELGGEELLASAAGWCIADSEGVTLHCSVGMLPSLSHLVELLHKASGEVGQQSQGKGDGDQNDDVVEPLS